MNLAAAALAATLLMSNTPATPPADEPLRLAVVGDSITAWSPAYHGDIAQSWVTTASTDTLPLVGGWARPGATLGEMEAAVTRADDADVLVIMGGTNDLYKGVPVESRIASIEAIAATVDAGQVVLAATAPYGYDWAAGAAWNGELALLAYQHGWGYIDPWADLRTPEGHWVTGADYGDLIHPNTVTAARVGSLIHHLLVDAPAVPLGGAI